MNKCDYEPETCENEPWKNITGTENKQIPMPLFQVQNKPPEIPPKITIPSKITIPRKYYLSKIWCFENFDVPKKQIFEKSRSLHDQSRSIEFNQSECQFSTAWYFLTCSLRSTSVVNKSEKYRNVPSTFPCLTLQWPFLLTKRVCRLRSDTSWFGKSLETRGLSRFPFVMLY